MRRGGYREREGVRRRAQAGANAWRAVEVVMTDRRIFKRLKVMSTLCDTGMPVQKGNLGNERTTTTKAASIRKQLGTKHSNTITRRAAELREEGRMTRWRPMLRWEACKERCEEGRRGGRLEEEEKRRREEKLSDEAVEKLGGGAAPQTP